MEKEVYTSKEFLEASKRFLTVKIDFDKKTDIARKYGESETICHAIEAHHQDVEPRTLLGVLAQAADAISAARPGARRETLDTYVKKIGRAHV